MFIKNALSYASVNVIGQAAQLAQRFVVRSIVTPAHMGIWELAVNLQGFVSNLDPGFYAAAWYELPVLHGQKDFAEEDRVRATSFWSNIVFSLVCALGVLSYALVFSDRFTHELVLAPLTAALLVLIYSVSQSFVTSYQARQAYVPLSKVSLHYALLNAILCPLGAYLAGIGGLLAGAVVSAAAQAFLLVWVAREEELRPRWSWSWRTFRRLVLFGLPLRIVDYPLAVFTYLDVFLITLYLEPGALGIYGTARTFFLQTANVSAMLGTVLLSRLLHLSGASRPRRELASEMSDFLIIQYLLVYPLLIIALLLGFSVLTIYFNPAYTDSIPILKVLAIAVYLVPQTSLVRNFWIMDRRLVKLGVSNIVGLLGMSGSLFFVQCTGDFTILSIAWATIAGYSVYYLYIMLTVGREAWGLGGSLRVCSCALLGASVVWFSLDALPDRFDPHAHSLWKQSIAILARMGICLALLVPAAFLTTRLADHLRRFRARLTRK